MNLNTVDSIVDSLVAKSGFLDKFGDIVELAKKGFKTVIQQSVVDNPSDKFDEQGKYIPNRYDSLFFNMSFKDTHNNDDLYASQMQKVEEEVIYCEENYSSLSFSRIEQSMGVGMTYIAEQIRDIYDEKVSRGEGKVTDFSVDKIRNELGGLRDVDFITVPVVGRKEETPPVVVHRKILNSILDRFVSNSDSVLFIGGDGGSASKRTRGYRIDCVYFNEKLYKSAVSNRKKIGGRGSDFTYSPYFFQKIPKNYYKAVVFNFIARKDIIDEIVKYFQDSNTLVFGMQSDPESYKNSNETTKYEVFQSERELEDFVIRRRQDNNFSSMPKNKYGILGISPNKVVTFNDHGIFIDDRWRHNDNFVSINRKEVASQMGIVAMYDGIECASLKILKNSRELISCFNFRISSHDYDEVIDTLRFFTVKNGNVYDDSGKLYYPHVFCEDARLLCYRGADMKCKFIDIDIRGTYWERRAYMVSHGIPLDRGDGLILDFNRSFDDPPLYYDDISSIYLKEYKSFYRIEHDEFITINPNNPTMCFSGFYYNPVFKKWCSDPNFRIPYIVVGADTPKDSGIDCILIDRNSTDKCTFKSLIDFNDPIPISDDLLLKVCNGYYSGVSYVRLYNYESMKIPVGFFSIEIPPKHLYEENEEFESPIPTVLFDDRIDDFT